MNKNQSEIIYMVCPLVFLLIGCLAGGYYERYQGEARQEQYLELAQEAVSIAREFEAIATDARGRNIKIGEDCNVGHHIIDGSRAGVSVLHLDDSNSTE